MTTLIARPHPLRSDLYQVELPAGASLASILPANSDYQAQVNGEPWGIERWQEPLPADAVTHVVSIAPRGDDVMGAVLMVAVAVASAYTGGAVGAAYGAAWGAAAAASVSVLGALAVNAIVPPKTSSMDSGTQSGSTIRSSLTGSQNRANPYGVIPRVYGNPRWFPPKAGNDVTESAGDDQYLRMLLCLGYGPLEVAGHRVGPNLPRLSNAEVGNAIRIGETNLGEYDEVDWEIGTRDQLTLYTQDIVEEVPGVALDLQDRTTGDKLLSSQDDVSAVRTTAVDATEISVDVVWPSGLYAMTSTGDMSPVNVEMLIEHREVGASEWVTKRSVIVSSESKTTVRKNWSWGVPKGQYDVRVTRVRTDGPNREAVVSDAQWSALRTIQGDNEAYGNDRHVLMALRIKATDQLNGVVDQLSIRTQSVLRVWNGESFSLEATNNPAWAYLDALTGEQVPRPITDAQINLPEIQAWAAFCDEAGLGYSWVHDGNETLFQRCRAIASTGQGSFSLQDGLYGIVRDSPSEPVTQMITPRNASNVRASRQFRKLPHGIRVKYVDFETGAATGTDAELIVYRDGFTDQNATIFEDFETQGVTSATEAAFQGNYYLRQAILRPETFTVDMDWENLAAVRGNRCSLASDVLKVGLASARISSIDDINNRITLDSEVEYTTERQYGLRVRQQDGEQVLIPVTADEVGYVDTLSIGGEACDLEPGDLVTYGVLDRETIDTKITRVDPGPDFTATLTLVPAAIDIYDFANDPIYDPGITNPIDPNQVAPPAPVITSARGDSTAASRNADGSYRTLIRVSYIFPVRVGSPTVQVEARYRLLSNPQWSHAGPFPATGSLAIADIEQHAEYVIQVRARNRDRVSAWSAEVSLDVTGHAAIAPTGVDVEIGTFSVTLRPVTIYAGSLFRFYRSAVELQPSQVESGAVNLGVAAVMVDTDLQPGTDYWYYVQAYTVYSSSEFYVLKVTTREDFDAIIGAIDDELRRPGGLVDQFQSGINDNAGAIDAAREEFETGLTEANTAIGAAQGRIDGLDTKTDETNQALSDARADLESSIAQTNDAVSDANDAISATTTRIDNLSDGIDADISGIRSDLTQAQTDIDNVESLANSNDERLTTVASDVETLAGTVGDNTASITETSRILELDGKLEAIRAAVSATQNAIGSASQSVETITRISNDEALSQRIVTLRTDFDGNVASVQQQLTALSTESQAIADSLESLQAEYDEFAASAEQRLTTLANDQEATAEQLQTLRAEYDQTAADFEQRITAIATETAAITESVESLTARLEDAQASIEETRRTISLNEKLEAITSAVSATQNAVGAATQSVETITRITNDEALSQRIVALSADFDGNVSEIREQLTTVSDEAQTIADSLSALRSEYDDSTAEFDSRITTVASEAQALSTRLDNLTSETDGSIADIQGQLTTLADDSQALSDSLQTLRSEYEGFESSATEQLTTLSDQQQATATALQQLSSEYDDSTADFDQRITTVTNAQQATADALSSLQSSVEDVNAEFDQRVTTLADETQAITESVTGLTSRLDDAESSIQETQRTVALNEKLEALTSAVSATQNAVGAATQTVETLTRISGDEALAQRITTLSVDFDGNVATLTQQLTTLADDTQAISDSLDSLSAEVGDSNADFEQRITALATETSAITQDVTSLQSQLGDAVASIDEVQQTQILDGIYSALQNAVVQTQSGVGSAVINVERLTSVSERNALAQQITDVSVEKDGQIAQVQQELSAVYDPSTGAVAQAITTVEVNGKKAMIGMQVDGQTAEIVAVANTFAVLNPISGELVTAFVVTDGRVVIPEALIDSLVVTKLRSTNGNLVFDGNKLKADYIDAVNLKVKWANVQDIIIRWADIHGVKIQTADIGDLAVTTQKIGDQAVTFPSGAYTDGGKWVADAGVGADNWMDVQTLTVGSTGAPTEIKISFAYEAQYEGYVYARVLRNGSVIWYSWVDKGFLEHRYRTSSSPDVVSRVPARGHASMILLVNPPSGNSTYKLQIGPEGGGGGVTVSRRYIGTLELKK